MDNEDRKRLESLAAALPPATKLRLTLNKHDQRDRFQAFGQTLKEAAPAIDLLTEITGDLEPPWMETPDGIRFLALPEGDKVASFVEALRPAGGGNEELPAKQRELLEAMPLPAEVRLFIAPGCPHCPRALEQWVGLAKSGSQLRLKVIDCALFPETIRGENIQAVPTLVLDDQLRWSGPIPVNDVLEQLVSRDPSRLSAEAMNGIIQEGQAGQLARAMLDSHTIFPAIIDLLTHDKWSVRLGAMVIVEEIAETAPALALDVVPLLRQRFEKLDDQARGDVLYILGEAGDRSLIPFLEKTARESTHPEIQQAASEAVATIQERCDTG